MSAIVRIGKKIKRLIKASDIPGANYMSLTRRIERVLTDQRICAMTFDDGPCALPPQPWKNESDSLTGVILDILKEFGATATFDVIGDTSGNYPDDIGVEGSPSWGGIKYDHYPLYEMDDKGGAKSQKGLIDRIIREGHEISNHSYRHILFGKKNLIYNKRIHYNNIGEVLDDLYELDKLMEDRHGYKMTLARPPHYVDKISNGLTSYDAYDILRYQYMAASFDGAGWLPLPGGYEDEVRAMWMPLEEKLKNNPDALRGQIIFQKDGYNMSSRSPVADGLRKQLEILKKYNYKVVSVSELLKVSKFRDISPKNPYYKAAAALVDAGKCVAYRDNTIRPSKIITKGELAMLLAPHRVIIDRAIKMKEGKGETREFADIKVKHPYSSAAKWAVEKGFMNIEKGRFYPNKEVTDAEFDIVVSKLGNRLSKFEGKIKRGDAINTIYELTIKAKE